MSTVFYVLFGLWLVFILGKLAWAAAGAFLLLVRVLWASRRRGTPEQKGANE